MIKFTNALELLNSDNESFQIGLPLFDSLIGGIEKGKLYLFCGDNDALRFIIHILLIKISKIDKVAYLNNTDYYSLKNTLDFDFLAYLAEVENKELEDITKNIYFAAAFNEFRQVKAVEELLRIAKETKFIIFDDINVFLRNSSNKQVAMENLKTVFYKALRYCIENKITLIATATTKLSNPDRIFLPNFILHSCHVVAFFRSKKDRIQAYLIKHYAKDARKKISISKDVMLNMGRITLPFREKYISIINSLNKNLIPVLKDSKHKEAFKALLIEAWDYEYAALSNSEIQSLMDSLNLLANLHNRSKIEALEKALKDKEKEIEELKRKLSKLEEVVSNLSNG